MIAIIPAVQEKSVFSDVPREIGRSACVCARACDRWMDGVRVCLRGGGRGEAEGGREGLAI